MSSLSLQPVQSCLVTHLWAVLGWDENQEILQALSTPAAVAAKSLQSCPTLCDPRDGSPPGSPTLTPSTLAATCWLDRKSVV